MTAASEERLSEALITTVIPLCLLHYNFSALAVGDLDVDSGSRLSVSSDSASGQIINFMGFRHVFCQDRVYGGAVCRQQTEGADYGESCRCVERQKFCLRIQFKIDLERICFC